MPVHDWTRVGSGIFHDFHGAWITEIRNVLNSGLLPDDFYALSEQRAGDSIADVLTLQAGLENGFRGEGGHPGELAVAVARPKVRLVETSVEDALLAKQRRVVVRHSSDDQIVALIEIVSPGNKAGRDAYESFIRKAVRAMNEEWHLLILDLLPPTTRDPAGLHGALWPELGGKSGYEAPEGKPLTLAAYEASWPRHAYVEPIGVGDELPEMPVFLRPGWYVNVPLKSTYDAAWRGVPRRWRDVLEPPNLL